MHDEIAKHGKQALATARRKELPLVKKVKEVALEIFIIVFAVTLSISLHSWSENRHEQQQVAEFLSDVREDLQRDITELEESKLDIDSVIATTADLSGLTASSYDSLRHGDDSTRFMAKLQRGSAYALTNSSVNAGNYEGFKSSGKIGYIRNKGLKKMILAYYEEEVPGITEVERYYNAEAPKLYDILMDINSSKGEEIFLNRRVKAYFMTTLQFEKWMSEAYASAIEQAQQIIVECGTEEEH